MARTSIFISGLGVVSAAGGNLDESLQSMATGTCNNSGVTLFETSNNYNVFEVQNLPEKYRLEGLRTLGLALCALDEAMDNAELDSIPAGLKVGVCIGTTVSSQFNKKEFYFDYRETGSASMEPVDRYLKSEISDYLLKRTGATGLSLTVVNACSSGSDAIGIAMSWLRHGLCDLAIAGGADELNYIPLCGFSSLGILSDEPCAPFDKNRHGLNLGEGAGIVILETASSLEKRGCKGSLSIAGYGNYCDAYHLTAPSPDGVGLKKAIGRAIEEAGIKIADIGFINAHGTATTDNDKVEGKALRELFGSDIKILSTKGYTGHTLGGAGGIEAVFTAAGLREGWIPRNARFETFDEEVGISPVVEKSAINAEYALSTSLAFGGINAALIIRLEK